MKLSSILTSSIACLLLALTNNFNKLTTVYAAPAFPPVTDASIAATWGWALVCTVLNDLKFFDKDTNTVIQNKFIHQRYMSNFSSAVIVTPNADTLYSPSVINLRQEPLVLHVPDTEGRYYVIPFYDLQTNVFARVGALTTGTKEGYVYITGPNFQAPTLDELNAIHTAAGLSPFVSIIQAPGYDAFNTGRIRSEGPSDVPTVNALQDQFSFTPYREHFNTSALPPYTKGCPVVTPEIPVYSQVAGQKYAENIPPSVFWESLSASVLAYPPTSALDKSLWAGWSSYGLSLTQQLKWDQLTASQQSQLTAAISNSVALQESSQAAALASTINNKWGYSPKDTAQFADSLVGDMTRAITARKFYAALPQSETIYYTRFADDSGKPLDSTKNYLLKMAAKPDVRGFWSITVYDGKTFFFFDTNKFLVGDHTPGLKYDVDGQLSIYIGATAPPPSLGLPDANWLPVGAQSNFYLVLRTYGPNPSVVSQTWIAPNVSVIA